jgi:hypothetical protein
MGPRLDVGRVGHGETTPRATADSDAADVRHAQQRKGSGQGAAKIQSVDTDETAERVSSRRRGSGSGA